MSRTAAIVSLALVVAVAVTGSAAPDLAADRARIHVGFRLLTRESRWTLVSRIPMTFPTFHPQGMVRVGDVLYVTSVEITTPTTRYPAPKDGLDRDAGQGVGHLFKVDLRPGLAGTLLASTTIGDGSIYHPGGLDFDGTSLWVPVAEYRPDSRSVIYRVDPETLKATAVVRIDDHIGGVVRDLASGSLHGMSWGSRRFYTWRMTGDGAGLTPTSATPAMRLNPSHYIDYQDCKFAAPHAMLCGGIAGELGGLDLVDLDDGRPLHQLPVTLKTPGGVSMTRNPVWIEPDGRGLRVWFMPEDGTSVLYQYDVR